MTYPELMKMAEKCDEIALNMSRRVFPNEIQWDNKALADAANAFTVARGLRALAEKQP
jgi:hypothetical protein